MNNANNELSDKFGMIDGNPLKYMLGIHVEREQQTGDIFIHQQKIIQGILRKYKADHLSQNSILALPNQLLFVDMSSTKENEYGHVLELPYRQKLGGFATW